VLLVRVERPAGDPGADARRVHKCVHAARRYSCFNRFGREVPTDASQPCGRQYNRQVDDRHGRRVGLRGYYGLAVGEPPNRRLAVAVAELAVVLWEPTPSRAWACLAIGDRNSPPGGAHGDRGVDDAQEAQAVADGDPEH
jgi:hypothetical protein